MFFNWPDTPKVPVLMRASTFPCNTRPLAHPTQHSKLHFKWFSHFFVQLMVDSPYNVR